MKRIVQSLLVVITISVLYSFCPKEEWGFFGHRRINRLAIFTLPPEIGSFYKKNIDFITEHAVDPDKRRYASKHEAVRHYIDIDHWGEKPFENVPTDFDRAVLKYGEMYIVTTKGDTLAMTVDLDRINTDRDHGYIAPAKYTLKPKLYHAYMEVLKAQYYKDNKKIERDQLAFFFEENMYSDIDHVVFVDVFSTYGILPYHLENYYYQLIQAFKRKDIKSILRKSTEIGHYIGDACVPLHTTENYNGQLTDQVGIHAFWESRIPELFASDTYDPISGRARFILEPRAYFWKIVEESHALCDDVLRIEKELSRSFPNDQQYCFVERLERTVRTQCEDYAATYSDRMNGMVEERWHRAINAVGSVWYSAWKEAGSPNLDDANTSISLSEEEKKALENAFRSGNIKGRSHSE